MKSQPRHDFDRKATLKHCWWWNVLDPKVWSGGPADLWDYSDQFEKQWYVRSVKPPGGLFAISYDTQHQRSAFLHEIGLRVDEGYRWKCPYIHLTEKQRNALLKRWPMDQALGDYELGSLKNKPKEGWTDFKGFSFNLNRNDQSLMRALKGFLQHERNKMRIPNPKPNQRRRNRGFSWKAVELMDLSIYANRRLSDAERSQVSKARKQYFSSL